MMPIQIISTSNVMAANGEIQEVLVQFSGVNLSHVDYISGTVKLNSTFHNLSSDEKNKSVLDKIKTEFWPEPFNEDKIDSINTTVTQFTTDIKNDMENVTTKVSAVESTANGISVVVTENKATTAQLMDQLNTVTKQVLKSDISNDDYAEMISIFPEWEVGANYQTGQIVRYNFLAWEVIQDHTSQEDWSPELAAALFKEVTPKKTTDPETGEEIEVIPDFVKPTGSHDAYMIGDKVQFENKTYESVMDNNTYSPAEYAQGWKEV